MAEKALKEGFTTGAAASAAVKAALLTLLTGRTPDRVDIVFLCGGSRKVAVQRVNRISDTCCEAFVIKDAGDDPDITHKAEIGARVILTPGDSNGICIRGGKGVGKVTKPGLEIDVGQPAINPGPVKMIRRAVHDAYAIVSKQPRGKVEVEIMVPKGEKLALKTLNPRLGILGGISILGTTGIVRPLSHDAYIATIRSAVSVASAKGIRTLVFTTGRRSERFAMDLFPDFHEEAFIQTGDFFKAGVKEALSAGSIQKIIYTVFFGKAVKMAMGHEHTHAAKSRMTLETLASWAEQMSKDPVFCRDIANANTARHAFSHIYPGHPDLIRRVGREIRHSALKFAKQMIKKPGQGLPEIRAVILDFNGAVAFDTKGKTK